MLDVGFRGHDKFSGSLRSDVLDVSFLRSQLLFEIVP